MKTDSFSINKVDASTSTPQPLEGASFALYRAVKNDQNQFIRVGLPIATAISNASGTGVVFLGLIPGEYLLYETSAPTGYVTPSEPWRITVNNDCVVDAHGLQANSDGAYIIENGKYPGILSITKKVEGYEMEEGMHYYINVTLTDAENKPLTGSFNGIRLENGSAIYELVKDATITFTGLPLGTKYTVEEVNFDGTALTGEEEYTSRLSTNATGTIDKEAGTVVVNVTVTNIYEIPETSAVISVKKIVDGTGYNQDEAFEFTLSAAEEGIPMPTETGNKVSIKAGETGSFGSITYTDTGIYYYTVKETKGSTVGMSYDETEYPVTVVVSMNDEHKLTASVYYNVVMTDIPEVEIDARALVVTNTYRVTSVSGTKTWRVPEGTELPESITVILKRNESPVDSKKVTAEDDWSYEFTELPAYSEDGSTAYTYTVDEEPVEGYITTVSGTNLINTITGTTSVSGTKTWRAPEGTELPESITVILNRNDEPVARKKVTAADDWSYEFTELPAYSEDGSTAYTYTVDEEPVEGYITTVSETNLINTITSVKISKVDIADGEELEGATIQLIDKETGEVVEEWTSTNEAHEVTGLTTGKTYILRETVAPEGYGITSDTTFELKEDGSIDTEKTTTTVSEEGVLLVEDTRRIDFIVNKVSATDDHELYDTILSVYEITDEGEVLVDSWTSRWKEVHNFGLKLSCGKSYILREDKATGGYHKIPGDILFNVTADGKIQITEGQDWKYENGKNVIEEVVDEAGNVIYLIRDVRNPEEEEETEPDGPTDPHQSETTTPEETTTSEEETTPEETTTSEEETSPEETTVSEEETTVSEEETTLPSPDDEESTPEVTTPAANTTTTAAETTVSETPTTTPSSERVILGIEDMSRAIGMALAGFGAIMLTALIWLYLRSKKA